MKAEAAKKMVVKTKSTTRERSQVARWAMRLAVVAAGGLLVSGCARVAPRTQRVAYDQATIRDRALRTVEARATWVTRWDYKTAADVRLIIKNCADAGFNTIFFQVRGNATAYYRSSIEPWAWELTSSGPATTGRDPGFDPLALAIESAHRRGVELHAYMNVFPGWRSQNYPPDEAGQVWTRHPDWFMADRQGRKMIPWDRNAGQRQDFYSFLNPAMTEVRDYTVAVFREVAQKYDVDGIHLDYCRYPGDVGDFSYDPVSLRRFREETGKTPDEAPDLWVKWRGRQVSEVANRIYDQCKKVRPDILITASLARDPIHDRDQLMRCGLEWMAAGKLDAACPMIYTPKNEEVALSVTQYVNHASGRLVVAGLMVRGTDPLDLLEQISMARTAGAHGVSLFSYSALFPKHKPNNLAKTLAAGPFRTRARVPLPSGDLPASLAQKSAATSFRSSRRGPCPAVRANEPWQPFAGTTWRLPEAGDKCQ